MACGVKVRGAFFICRQSSGFYFASSYRKSSISPLPPPPQKKPQFSNRPPPLSLPNTNCVLCLPSTRFVTAKTVQKNVFRYFDTGVTHSVVYASLTRSFMTSDMRKIQIRYCPLPEAENRLLNKHPFSIKPLPPPSPPPPPPSLFPLSRAKEEIIPGYTKRKHMARFVVFKGVICESKVWCRKQQRSTANTGCSRSAILVLYPQQQLSVH